MNNQIYRCATINTIQQFTAALPVANFLKNRISLTFILRRSVPRQLHAGTVRLWRWNSNHSDLGNKKLTIRSPIFSTITSGLIS